MPLPYPELVRGVVVQWESRGLYVIAERVDGLRGRLDVQLIGIETGTVAVAGNMGVKETVQGWQIRAIPRPKTTHAVAANLILGITG